MYIIYMYNKMYGTQKLKNTFLNITKNYTLKI